MVAPAWTTKGAFADARVGYNYSDNGSQQQLNYALSGSLVAHSQGITHWGNRWGKLTF
ncbi:hypothetical protein KZ774_18410 [Escherichia coli]|nr:hypothetical protein [Escherichia coli]